MIKGAGTLLLVQPLKLLIKYFNTGGGKKRKSGFTCSHCKSEGVKKKRQTLFCKKRLALRTNARKKDFIIIKNPIRLSNSSLNKDWMREKPVKLSPNSQ